MGKENKLAMIKICGIKDMNTAHIAIDAGVNALGFVFAEIYCEWEFLSMPQYL